jgi:hypothetical protein
MSGGGNNRVHKSLSLTYLIVSDYKSKIWDPLSPRLIISRQISEAYGGTFWAKNLRNIVTKVLGTCFTVVLIKAE